MKVAGADTLEDFLDFCFCRGNLVQKKNQK